MAVGKVRSAKRPYYSARTGKVSGDTGITLPAFRRAFNFLFDRFQGGGYFHEAFGDWKLTSCFSPGKLGDIPLHIERRLHKTSLWPVPAHVGGYEEDDFFDMLELLFDYVSKPLKSGEASPIFGGRHWFSDFDQKAGRREFRAAANELLEDYKGGFELTSVGEIRALPDAGMEPLVATALLHPDASNVVQRVEMAKQKFLRRGATIDDRRDAVSGLASVLEYLRPEAKKVLVNKDESDLFQIANEFGIRHHNQRQKTQYDEEIWVTWMFYHYLASIHACVRLIQKSNQRP